MHDLTFHPNLEILAARAVSSVAECHIAVTGSVLHVRRSMHECQPIVRFVIQVLLECRALGGEMCMDLYLRFHQAKTLTGNCKNRAGKLKKVLPLLFPLNMFFQHLECLAL